MSFTESIKKMTDRRPNNIALAMEVFDKYGDFILSTIRFHAQNKIEPDDLFQDFFLFLVSKPLPQNLKNAKGFLFKIISDKVKDTFRKTNRYQSNLRRYALCNRPVVENRPEKTITDLEEVEKMFELIYRHLPSNEALAIKLRYSNNCDIEEAACEMDVLPRTISRYVSVGLKKIRQILWANEGDDYDSI